MQRRRLGFSSCVSVVLKLVLVTPRTVVNWHRAGFRLYWAWVSRLRRVGGRKRVSKEVRALIFRMVAENPTWGAPRIHGELLKLGFDVSERSVSRWIQLLTMAKRFSEIHTRLSGSWVQALTTGVRSCGAETICFKRRFPFTRAQRPGGCRQANEFGDYGFRRPILPACIV